MQRIECQPAFVLHTRPYSDSSLIVHFFTRDFGRINALAKGARNTKSKRQKRQALQAFTPFNIDWQGKSDLKTLTAWEADHYVVPLQGNNLYSGMYINELLLKLLPENDPLTEVFESYSRLLAELSKATDLELILRQFELGLLADIGYAIDFTHDASGKAIVEHGHYGWLENGGFVPMSDGLYRGDVLDALSRGDFQYPQSRKQAKELMRHIFWLLLDKKPLKTRLFLQQMQKK